MLHTHKHLHSGWFHSHDTHSGSEAFSRFEVEFAVAVLLFAKALVVVMLLLGLLMITSSRVSGSGGKFEHQSGAILMLVDQSIAGHTLWV